MLVFKLDDMKKILLTILIGWGACSCSDFLEPDSPSEYMPKTVEALNEMLLGEAYPTATSAYLFCLHNALNDDIEMSEENISYRAATIESTRLIYSWHPEMFELTSVSISQLWRTYYSYILGTNAALDYLNDVSGTENEKAYVRAQAYALRAFYYFNLVNLFGEPYNHDKNAGGVSLKLTSSLSSSYEARETVGEVYEQIIKDLDEAEKSFLTLPEEQQKKGTYRMTLPAVQLIRARVCLHINDMEGAAKYAKKVIDDWDYELYDLNFFRATNDVAYPNYAVADNSETIWTYGNVSDAFNAALTVMGYLQDGTTAAYSLNASADLVACFKEGDLRKDLYLVKELRGPANATKDQLKPAEGHYLPWSKCPLAYNNAISSNKNVFGMSLRLSEAYLILAEAVYDTDKKLALQMINDLRRKRYTDDQEYTDVNYSGEDLLDFIREERRRELCFEGQRWFDLRRYGMPSFKHRWVENGTIVGNYVLEEGDAAYTLPIPASVLERNPALKQNELTTPKTL